MLRRTWIPLCVVLCGALLAGCAARPTPTSTPAAALPNPASVHCEGKGGRLEMRTDAAGGVAGWCIFADGSQCDEWAFFRGECRPGDSLRGTSAAPASATPAATAPGAYPAPATATGEAYPAPAAAGWRTYRDDALGFSFDYPADARIVPDDNPPHSITIEGPEVNGGRWPSITISHPQDRPEFRPPAGADLLQWLTEHNLLGDARAADVTIAGETAVHLRHERSPQSYAYDRYCFAHAGQLYMVVIGHTGDKEDWAVYDRFLGSIRFER